jgi:hypothetical protein
MAITISAMTLGFAAKIGDIDTGSATTGVGY